MKISKLFHWLYGFLMLLPVFGVLFKVGYVMLNENAYQSYSGSYIYDSSVKVNSINQYLTNTYYYMDNELQYVGETYFENLLALQFTDISTNQIIFDSGNYNYNYYNFFLYGGGSGLRIAGYNTLTDHIGYGQGTTLLDTATSSYDLKISKIIFSDSFLYNSNNPIRPYLIYDTFVFDNSLSSVFYSSLQEINNTEFFSWAKDSFLVQPIMYIGNLFGISNPHPIFTFMSYWLSISIIWLVFDLVMYLPLLVHRWLDKGVIE